MIRIKAIMSLTLASLVALTAQAEDGPKFKHVIPTDSVQFVRVFSADSRVGAMLFDNLIIDTEIGRGTLPSVRTKQFSYVLQPVSDKEVCVVQRFFTEFSGAPRNYWGIQFTLSG